MSSTQGSLSPLPVRPHHLTKRAILSNRVFNKGTAFTAEERVTLGIRGLLPPTIETIEIQSERVIQQFRSLTRPLEKYIFIQSLKERNETLFYYVLTHHLEEMLPIVYTPTVGDACLNFAHIWRVSEGMYFSDQDKGSIRSMMDNWDQEVDIIVVTDGSRILGLGDLGANGMGIPIGKLSLYVAAAGFHPSRTLPVLLDTGTNNQTNLTDPLYLGLKHKRLGDDQYYPFVDEFLAAAKDKWPNALLQFEDFSNEHCFELLERYRDKQLCFNDDIQGTGAVVASGFINACKVSGVSIDKQRVVFFGAGSAGIGVADTIVAVMVQKLNITKEQARKSFYFVDSKGLVTKNRGDTLASFKVPYARDDFDTQYTNLLDVIKAVKPTGLIGLSGMPQSFTEEIIKELASHSKVPVIFSLSNPTSKAECSAEQAFTWTEGRCIFASGSPFAPTTLNGKTYYAGQGNNMYIFPGLGFGSFLARSKKVSDRMIIAATTTLSDFVTEEELARGQIYPRLNKIREISAIIAAKVIEVAFEEGHAQLTPKPNDLLSFVRQNMFDPVYSRY
eukprot:TRINITY_DN3281_c0_g1_i2.p1 TRINITY_DN3281_c0_g1~~TRINITY_DN3281_c0_g1_i2.p1  ORF type:complete len:559 (-),score=151.85 TRINITY_DN3281_c0_g1_i2:33-1709(-)